MYFVLLIKRGCTTLTCAVKPEWLHNVCAQCQILVQVLVFMAVLMSFFTHANRQTTGTMTGQYCIGVWSGRASSAPLSPTVNPQVDGQLLYFASGKCCNLVFVYCRSGSFGSISLSTSDMLLTCWRQYHYLCIISVQLEIDSGNHEGPYA